MSSGFFIDPINQILNNKLGRHEMFTANGTWTRPTNISRIYVTMCGAGGDGGDSASVGGVTAGGGGGGSGAWCVRYPITVSTNLTIVAGLLSDSSIADTTSVILLAKKGGDGVGYGTTGNGGTGGGWGTKNVGAVAEATGNGANGAEVLTGSGYWSGLWSGASGGATGNGFYGGNITGGLGGATSTDLGGGGGAGSPFGSGGVGASRSGPVNAGNASGFGAGGGGGADNGVNPNGGLGSTGFVLIEWDY